MCQQITHLTDLLLALTVHKHKQYAVRKFVKYVALMDHFLARQTDKYPLPIHFEMVLKTVEPQLNARVSAFLTQLLPHE